MKIWKWFLVVSAAAIFIQIVLAGLMFMGFGLVHTTFGHLIFIPVLVTLILARRQKAGRTAVGLRVLCTYHTWMKATVAVTSG